VVSADAPRFRLDPVTRNTSITSTPAPATPQSHHLARPMRPPAGATSGRAARDAGSSGKRARLQSRFSSRYRASTRRLSSSTAVLSRHRTVPGGVAVATPISVDESPS
jgi:hypothetical protein